MEPNPRHAAEEALARVHRAREVTRQHAQHVTELSSALAQARKKLRAAEDHEEELEIKLDIICNEPPPENSFLSLPFDVMYIIFGMLNVRDKRALAAAHPSLAAGRKRASKDEYEQWLREARYISLYPRVEAAPFESATTEGVQRLQKLTDALDPQPISATVTAECDGVLAFSNDYFYPQQVKSGDIYVAIEVVAPIRSLMKHPVFPDFVFFVAENKCMGVIHHKSRIVRYFPLRSPTAITRHGNTLCVGDMEEGNTYVY